MNDGFPVRIFDGHNDAILDIGLPSRAGVRSLLDESEIGHIDLPRARRGGLAGGLFALFVPNDPERMLPPESDFTRTEQGYTVRLADPIAHDYAVEFTDNLLTFLQHSLARANGAARVCTSVPEIRSAMDDGVLAMVLHFEGADVISPDLSNLDYYYERGLRSLGLVWSRPNAFGQGVPFAFPASPDLGPGLTEAGRELVKACNQRGIVVDMAHMNEQGFRDVASITDRPLVVTHAGVHRLCPTARNITDKQLDAIAESGGVIGITFFVGDIRGGADFDTSAISIEMIVDHVAYVAERCGVDCVALGSDFDGAQIPDELGSASGLQRVVAALRARGFDESEINRICRENWMRVLDATWR
jgi:membrane dipeptidase